MSRLAPLGLSAILLFLAVFSLWGAVRTDHLQDSSHRQSQLARAYEHARAALVVEDLAVTKYLRLLGPGAKRLDARELRANHREAQATLLGALGTVARVGHAHDRRVAKGLVGGHGSYLRAVARLWAAVDAGDARRAFAVEVEDIAPAFEALEHPAGLNATQQRRQAFQAEKDVDSAQKSYIAAVLFLFPLAFALLALLALVLRRYRRDAEATHRGELERLERAALTDSLTELRNHRAFQEDLGRQLERLSRSGSPLGLVLLDLDGLKETNDCLGHQAGDERLKALASCLSKTVRAADAAYRVSGDEFAVILDGSRAWGAFSFVQRLQANLRDGASPERPTVTAGIAEAASPLTTKDELIRQADLALMEAKRSHREALIYSEGLEPYVPELDRDAQQHHLKTLTTALARAVDAKDSYTRSHCETVSEGCALIAQELGLGPERTAKLRLAGLLHDVGKIGVADELLRKPTRLTDEEFEIMKTHSTLGQSIVQGAELEDEAHWILHHHERPDGRGYPGGLVGEEIPLESRIILVADAFEAMTSDRPYRKGMPEECAWSELERHAGTQFDPECVAALGRSLGKQARAPEALPAGP